MMPIDTDVLVDAGDVSGPESVDRYLAAQVDDVNRYDLEAWRGLHDLAGWEAFKRPRIDALARSLGTFPEVPDRIEVEVTGTITEPDYAIDKLVFVSRPGILVTANVYRPTGDRNAVGMLLVHSHHNPRTQVELQDMGVVWARAGCTVLVMDEFAYGERRIHPPGQRHDYWNRYNTGAQLALIGESLMGWMVWDIRRGIDVLEQQYGTTRTVLVGAVAGGGDPCAVAAALDERVEVSIPFNFGGPQPETRHPLPEDAEMAFNYMGSGSWETTRNLTLSGRDGFLPWVIVAAAAPRKLIYAHEFAWDQDNDPVWKRLQTIYDWYDAADHLDWVKGFGGVKLRPPNASHCNNVGPVHRERIHKAFQRWLNLPVPEDREARRPESDLLSLPNRAGVRKLGGQAGAAAETSYLTVFRRILDDRRRTLEASLASLTEREKRERLRDAWTRALGPCAASAFPTVVHERTEEGIDATVERKGVMSTDGVVVPIVLLRKGQPSRITVIVSQKGKGIAVAERRAEIDGLLTDEAVCLVDVRGVGELGPDDARTFRGRFAARAATALMIGESVLGMQLRDLRTVIAYLRSAGYAGITVQGAIEAADGGPEPTGERDDPERSEVVARSYVEPLGAVLATLAGVFEEGVSVRVEADLRAEMHRLLEGHRVDWPVDAVVPGMAVRI